MASFITTPSTVLPFRPNTTSAKCALKKTLFPTPSRPSNPIMQAKTSSPNEHNDEEDDDATIGVPSRPSQGYGVQLPPLSPSDQIYLDGATNNKEYMARVNEIVLKMVREGNLQRSRQTSDAYIDQLSRQTKPPVEGDYGGPRITASDEYMQNLSKGIHDHPLPENRRKASAPAGPPVDPTMVVNPTDSVAEVEDKMRAIEEEIQHVSQAIQQSQDGAVAQEVMEKLNEMAKIREIEAAVEEVEDALDMTLEEGERQIAQLQKEIREAVGLEEPSQPEPLQSSIEMESQPELDPQEEVESQQQVESQPQVKPQSKSEASSPTDSPQQSQDPETVDKQIQFLESYLSKLQNEAAEDPEARAEQNVQQEQQPDVAEEMQTTMSSVAEQISKMPSQRTSFEGLEDTPGEMSAEQKMAMFEQLRRRAASSQSSSEFADPLNVTLPQRKTDRDVDRGDEPSPESEAEYDAFESSSGDKSLLIEEIETEVNAYTRDVKALLQKHGTRLQVLLARLRAL